MIVGALFPWKKVMTPVFRDLYSYRSGPNTTTTVRQDTGQRIQCTPCWGIGSGIGAIIVIMIVGEDFIGTPQFALLYPGIIGAVIGILAAVIFFIEDRGPYIKQV